MEKKQGKERGNHIFILRKEKITSNGSVIKQIKYSEDLKLANTWTQINVSCISWDYNQLFLGRSLGHHVSMPPPQPQGLQMPRMLCLRLYSPTLTCANSDHLCSSYSPTSSENRDILPAPWAETHVIFSLNPLHKSPFACKSINHHNTDKECNRPMKRIRGLSKALDR